VLYLVLKNLNFLHKIGHRFLKVTQNKHKTFAVWSIFQNTDEPSLSEDSHPMKYVCTFCDFDTFDVNDFFLHFNSKHKKTEPEPEREMKQVSEEQNGDEVICHYFVLNSFY